MSFHPDSFYESPLDIENEDILTAMKKMQGYIDITPADFQEIYNFAYRHALERIAYSRQAQDIMTREVIYVSEDSTLLETAELMAKANISGVPVVDNNDQVNGVISEKDFLQEMGVNLAGSFMGVISQCLKGRDCLVTPICYRSAKDIMTVPALTVDPERSLSAISDLLIEKRINRVPVVDAQGKPVGIVTRNDIVQSFFAKES